MRLSSLADYAIVVMSAIARHDGDVRFSATSLAEETGVPLPTAQKLMGRLAAAGLLESARGTGGGFALARPAGEISLADIVEAVEGPIAMTACIEETRHECALEENCRVRPHWGAVNGAIRGALAGVSLESLAGEIPPPPFVSSEVETRHSEPTSLDFARDERIKL
ncbi:MAG TPA: SUF system Fe-S cluster assembly regulator [Rhizorhapis sp.]|nr:SUF system Fe-S cluster assembly regulator [Rhizorhapis sp.]